MKTKLKTLKDFELCEAGEDCSISNVQFFREELRQEAIKYIKLALSRMPCAQIEKIEHVVGDTIITWNGTYHDYEQHIGVTWAFIHFFNITEAELKC